MAEPAPDRGRRLRPVEGSAPPSFEALYNARHDDLVRLAYLLTGSYELAQDVVQDAFVRAYPRLGRVREPVPYLRRAVVNGCLSHHRRTARGRRIVVRVVDEHPTDLDADELGDALAALPPRQRAALVLRYYHDLSDADIATALRCRPGTVASLIHRGLAQLRKAIEP
ncbi:MAG TPA: SigE family RNA polymerase sigma factor [Acidimicrobiales bacterium]